MKLNKKIVAAALVGIVMMVFNRVPVNASSILGADVTKYIASRSGTVSVGVYDANTGKTYTYNPSKTYWTESVVKMSMLADVLYQKIPITNYEDSLLTKMIENSNNSAASAIWQQLGSDKNVQSFFRKAGMINTIAGTGGWWGHTTTNVTDQLTMMKYFAYPNSLLTNSQRMYGLNLMKNIEADQRWGTSYGVPKGVSIALKNGWVTSGKYVNSVGYINGQGKNYVIAVLTANNKSFSYGIETIGRISSLVWNETSALGWVFSNGNWYYYTPTGKFNGWLYDNKKWYYLDSSGVMEKGWLKDRSNWYYLNNDGSMRTGWLLNGGNWYFMNKSGAMETGWLDLSGMKYFLTASGSMVTGWKQIGGSWYFFYQNGQMAADTVIDGYKLGQDGARAQ